MRSKKNGRGRPANTFPPVPNVIARSSVVPVSLSLLGPVRVNFWWPVASGFLNTMVKVWSGSKSPFVSTPNWYLTVVANSFGAVMPATGHTVMTSTVLAGVCGEAKTYRSLMSARVSTRT